MNYWNIKKYYYRIERIFSNITFEKILFYLAIIFTVLIFVSFILIINTGLSPDFSINGFHSFFEIFEFPLKLLAGLLAIVTLKITVKRIIQVDRQLDSSYRPELFIEDSTVAVQLHHNSHFAPVGGGFIKINNVGLAVAKRVKVTFYFYKQEVLDPLKKVNKPTNKNYFTFEFDDENEKMIVASNYNFWSPFETSRIQENYFTFILPNSESKKGMNLPIGYLQLLQIYTLQLLELENNLENFNFRPLICTTEYHDLGNKLIMKHFEIYFKPENKIIKPFSIKTKIVYKISVKDFEITEQDNWLGIDFRKKVDVLN
jgi:hypothetical protein